MRLGITLTILVSLLLQSAAAYSNSSPSAVLPITVLNATLPGDQINPSVASLPGNQFVMTWSDRASLDGDRGGIFGRLYDETMTPLTSEFVVNTLTADWQSKSNVASAPNGTFMAIWHQSNGWVEGQLFNASGEKQGPQFTVQEGFNGLSDVVADASGNFWVVSTVNNGSGYISKYSNTGEVLVDSLVYQSEVVASDPVITALSDGRVLVSWHDGQNPSGSDIYGQFITAEGLLSGTPFVVNTTTAENQSKPAIAALTSGGFVVAWQSLLQDGDLAGVYARVFDNAGAGGSEILVNTSTTGNQVQAYVTARSDGGFVVGWADAAAPPQGQVYLQSYTAAGEPQGDNQLVSVDDVTTINNSVNIELTELTDGSLVAVWNAWNGSQNIYGRTFKLLTITETDSDGDGVVDTVDAFPSDPSETTDTDGDGVGDNADVFPSDATETVDSDGDGVGDNTDAFPDDGSEAVDTDGDGVGDNADAFPNDPTEDTDADGDGVGANTDLDDNDPLVGLPGDPDTIVTLTDVNAELGEVFRVYMTVSEVTSLTSIDASVLFDPVYLELVAVEAEPALAGWLFQSFSPEPGLVNIATTTTSEFSGSGRLVAIDFRLIRSPEEPLTVMLESLLLNGGTLVGEAVDGNVTELIVHRISGSVSYWSDASRALPSTVNLGDRQATITSLSSDYSIGGLETGSYVATVTIDQLDNRAIRAYDASLVLGMSVGAIEVNDVNIVASDVDKSGDVNSADARLILRYAVGLDSIPFPNQDGIWVPLPERYEYPNLNDDVTDADFIGVLVGDVSGNWKPTQTSAKWSGKDFGSLAIESDPLVAEVVETAANTFEVTLSLTEAVELSAVEVVLTTTSGVTLDTHESLLGSSWVSSVSTTDTTITFGATKFPASSIEDVVKFTLTTAGSGESLVSALTILDEDEFEQTLNITLGTSADSDEDGLTDAEEAELGTDPNNADSDGDGLADGIEVELGTSPTTADTDGDGYTDGEEQAEGTSPTDADDAPSAGLSVLIFKAAIDAANAAKLGTSP